MSTERAQSRTLEQLEAENAALRRENEKLREQIEELRRQLEEAKREGKRQAGPFRRKKRKENPKRPGRKPGHPGAHRAAPDDFDQTKTGPELCSCPHCGGPVDDRHWCENYETDTPEPRVVRTRFRFQSGWCPHCGKWVYAPHPDQTSTATGAAASHVGPRARALMASMKFSLGTPFRKAARFMAEVYGLVVTAGGIVQGCHRLAAKGQPTCGAMMLALRQERVAYSDETGWLVGTLSAWLWVMCSARFTLYHVEDDRCADVVLQFLGASFQGWLMRDGWASYDTRLKTYSMLLCLLHLKRNVKALDAKQTQGAVKSPRYFLDWLERVFALRHEARELEPSAYAARAEALVEDYDWFVSRNYSNPRNAALATRLAACREQILPIVRDPSLPAINDRGEQQTRPGVIIRKISAGNKTWKGAATFGTLASIGASCTQQGVSFFQVLIDIVRAPQGTPVIFWQERPEPLALPAPALPRLLAAPVRADRAARVFALPARLEPAVTRVFALPARLVSQSCAPVEPAAPPHHRSLPATTAAVNPNGNPFEPATPTRPRIAPLPPWARRQRAPTRPRPGG